MTDAQLASVIRNEPGPSESSLPWKLLTAWNLSGVISFPTCPQLSRLQRREAFRQRSL